MAVFGPELRRFGRAPPDLAPPPRAATGEFLAQNLDLARAPPRLQDGYMGKRSEALGQSNGQNGKETCCCCCCCLLLVACCPSPNSRWLHHTALRYVRRAQRGAYMCWKGLNSVKTGSKWAQNTCLSIPNGPGSLLEKRVFDPFFTQFCSQNGPFSRHFGILHEPKRVTTGSKWAKTTCLSIINGPRSFLKKRVFDPFFTQCWSQNGPFSRHFGIFHGSKRATTGSKRPKNTCLSIPSGLGTTLEKIFFFALGTLVDPPLAPTVRGLAGPPAAPSDQWYGGLRVSLGDYEAWKP